ncbi:ABC transporter substrate-binding protein [Salibaculum griseiflavum]|uniref:ABC transporter substrate-binding protein n=1 Tax=Salibaculum griseiflavum TaxID=1914409 RepID=A0A2V1P4A5_9RHOB|nr:extracellular solute-binding protein [Salibaculum griseiflavum]PWG16674.1 ABC transporter substrate-binding protein [Salibaculum griseiflavum]
MKLKTILMAGAMSVAGSVATAECAFENTTELRSLTAGFEAWKAVTDAMAECGNFEANLDQEFREKQPEAFAADPSLYHIGGVANSTMIPLLNAGTIRPLNDLVEQYGQNLKPNQLITVGGDIMAIAMMVNNQHLMYREDILDDLGLDVPTTYDEVLAAAAVIEEAGVVDYPLGGTFMTGWNLGEEFVNMYLGEGGQFVDDNNMPTINNERGIASLEMMKALTEYMDPEYLVSDSTYVQQQFQQGKIAMANLWASRAGAMNDEAESQVVGLVKMASAPMGSEAPASSIWWDGIVIASNITDEEAEAAFRVAMEGIDSEMVQANQEAAVWLIDGYEPGDLAAGAAATAANGARPYPASGAMGIMHTALGNGIADYLNGNKDAETTLADIEAAYMTAAEEAGLIE